MNTAELAARDAQRDWMNKKAAFLFVGDVKAADGELCFDPAGLYIRLAHDAAYASAYNSTIQQLLQQTGIPPWVPMRRLPKSREEAVTLLSGGAKYAHFRPRSDFERKLLRIFSIRGNGYVPTVFRSIEDRAIILFGGYDTRTGVIDVADVMDESLGQSFSIDRDVIDGISRLVE
jgi:hypothetical protein